MRLTCRPHAAPQPPEPTVELYLSEYHGSVNVIADEKAIVKIKHDGERFTVKPLNNTRVVGTSVDQPRPAALLEALRPIIEDARKAQLNLPTEQVYDYGLSVNSKELASAIAAFDAADKQPAESGEPKRTLIRMTDKLPDRPGLWLRKIGVGSYQVTLIRDKKGTLVRENSYPIVFYPGPWSEQPLEIIE